MKELTKDLDQQVYDQLSKHIADQHIIGSSQEEPDVDISGIDQAENGHFQPKEGLTENSKIIEETVWLPPQGL